MKPFNQPLNHDITQLKLLHAKKDKTDFREFMEQVKRRHNISKATVYREMKKDTPGLYKTPRYFPPQREVTPKEREMVENLLRRQFTVQDIINIMERETGENYSWDRIDRIRESITNFQLRITNEKQEPQGEGCVTEIPPLNPLHIKDNTDVLPLAKGEMPAHLWNGQAGQRGSRNIRRVVEELLEADKMTEGETIAITLGGSEHTISRDAARDIALVIANYIDAGEESIGEMNRLRLMHLVTDKIRLVSLGSYASVRELKELCDMNAAMSEKTAKQPMTIQELIASTQ